MKPPPASATHSRWLEAVASGVHDRYCSAFTPITLTCRPRTLMAAPSTASTSLTPRTFRSAAAWAALRPCGSITARAGRAICRNPEPLPAGRLSAGHASAGTMRVGTVLPHITGPGPGWLVPGVSGAMARTTAIAPKAAAPRRARRATAAGRGAQRRGRLLIAINHNRRAGPDWRGARERAGAGQHDQIPSPGEEPMRARTRRPGRDEAGGHRGPATPPGGTGPRDSAGTVASESAGTGLREPAGEPPANPYLEILRLPGALAFSASGFLARMPMSMFSLGAVLLIAAVTRRHGLAGLVAAAGMVGYAVGAPQFARLSDRFGQRRVLRPQVAVSAAATVAFVTLAGARPPLAATPPV